MLEKLIHSNAPTNDLRSEHVNYLREMGKKGVLLMAGKFNKGNNGIIIWKVSTLSEAEELAKDDPYSSKGKAQIELQEMSLSFDYTALPPLVG